MANSMMLSSLQEDYDAKKLRSPFSSFWMGGYECTDQLNAFGNRVDFLHITGHYEQLEEDYARLNPFNISSVREGLRWSQVEKTPYQYDWSTVKTMMEKGKKHQIQQIWDICHFGFPDDLTPLHPLFARRFAGFCRAFVHFYRSVNPDSELIVTPVNEVSFLSWLGGDARGTSPYCWGQGWEVKYALMRAYIEGTAAMREIDPSIRILTTEPLVNVVPPLNPTEDQVRHAQAVNEDQFQSIDMLSGRMCPELGGSEDFIDILGFNFYYDNQWIVTNHEVLPWRNLNPDPRFKPLRALLKEAYLRYNKPFVITETSHSGEDRPIWIKYVAKDAASLIAEGLPLLGICIYPIIDRPDWDHLHRPWHRSGLWDAGAQTEGNGPERILYKPYAKALTEGQAMIDGAASKQPSLKSSFVL